MGRALRWRRPLAMRAAPDEDMRDDETSLPLTEPQSSYTSAPCEGPKRASALQDAPCHPWDCH